MFMPIETRGRKSQQRMDADEIIEQQEVQENGEVIDQEGEGAADEGVEAPEQNPDEAAQPGDNVEGEVGEGDAPNNAANLEVLDDAQGGLQPTQQEEAHDAHHSNATEEAAQQQEMAPVAPFFADPAEGTMLVRFTARPEGFYFEQNFPLRSPCLILYKRLETQLYLERRNVQLYWEGRPLSDADIVSDACVIPEADNIPLCLDLEVENVPEHLRLLSPGEQAVKAVRTQVHYGDDIPAKDFFITVVKGFDRKPFVGGWRHKAKGTLYHNATTQCSVESSALIDMSGKLSRTTQTIGVTRSSQTRRECGTQMPRSDLLVDETYDRVRIAKPYFSSDRLAVLQTQKTILLQAFVRGWRARKIARRMRAERDSEELALALEDARRREDHQKRRQSEVDRRTHPKSAQDFSVLHNELEAWRLQEVQRINSAEISEAERRIAMMELLKKQTKLLQTIDRLQIQASKENRFRKINTVLNNMSSAKKWGTTTTVNVETPFTVRARELRDLYNGLQLAGIGIDERLDILLHVKWTVKEFECPLTREIVELVDREADLLNRGRKDVSLTGLRQRLSNLFLQFVETPEFNPEAAQFQRVPLEYTSRPLVKLDRK